MKVVCLSPAVELKFKNELDAQPLFGCESLRLLRYKDVLFIDCTALEVPKLLPSDIEYADALAKTSVLILRGIPEPTSLEGFRVDCVSTEETKGSVESLEAFEKTAARFEREIVFLEPSEVCDETFLDLITKE